jgi:hypothetical protein
MAKKEPKRRLKVVKGLAPDPFSPAELEAAEDTLAHLVALAYRADYPDLFGAQQGGAGDAPAVRLPIHEVAQQPIGAEVVLGKVLKCAPRGKVRNERTFARSA